MSAAADEFSGLSPRGTMIVAGAAVMSLIGTLLGLAGLLMWGIKASDMLFPSPEGAPAFVDGFAPYLTIFNFVLTVLITICGVFNLMLAARGQDFVDSGWKRWMVYSVISVVAAALFFTLPEAA